MKRECRSREWQSGLGTSQLSVLIDREGWREGIGEEEKKEEMLRPNNLSPAITEHNATQLPCLNVRKRNFSGSLDKSL